MSCPYSLHCPEQYILNNSAHLQTAQQDALRKLQHKDKRRQTALQRLTDRKKKGKKKAKGGRAAATSSSEEREDSDSESGREDELRVSEDDRHADVSPSADGRSQDDEDDEICGEDHDWDMAERRKRKRRAPATEKKRANRFDRLQDEIKKMNKALLNVTPPPERQQTRSDLPRAEAESAAKLQLMQMEKEIKTLELEAEREKTKQLQLQAQLQQAAAPRGA